MQKMQIYILSDWAHSKSRVSLDKWYDYRYYGAEVAKTGTQVFYNNCAWRNLYALGISESIIEE